MESKGQKESETLELKETGNVDSKIQPEDLKGKDERSELINNKEAETNDVGKKTEEHDKEEDEKKDVEKPLIDEKETETVIYLGSEDEKLPGEDTPTLPISDKKKPISDGDEKDKKEEEPPSMFLHPIDTLRYAWKNSKSIPDFLLRAVCIMFGSIGWIFCVGGVPFLPLVMLIIGSIFVDDCPLEPRIPVYLVVAGLFGLIQHVTALVTKYLPKEKQRISDVQKRWCTCLDSVLQTFLFVWFIAGCVWVYSNYEPNYDNPNHPDYCHKTVYLFTFWMFNISFIILCSLIVFALCAIICVVTTTVKLLGDD